MPIDTLHVPPAPPVATAPPPTPDLPLPALAPKEPLPTKVSPLDLAELRVAMAEAQAARDRLALAQAQAPAAIEREQQVQRTLYARYQIAAGDQIQVPSGDIVRSKPEAAPPASPAQP